MVAREGAEAEEPGGGRVGKGVVGGATVGREMGSRVVGKGVVGRGTVGRGVVGAGTAGEIALLQPLPHVPRQHWNSMSRKVAVDGGADDVAEGARVTYIKEQRANACQRGGTSLSDFTS